MCQRFRFLGPLLRAPESESPLWGQDLQVWQESQVRRTLPEAEHCRTAAGRMCDRQGKSGPCVSTAGHLLLLLTARWRICRVGLSGTLCFRVLNEQRGKGLESVLQQSAEPALPVLQALLVPQGLPAGGCLCRDKGPSLGSCRAPPHIIAAVPIYCCLFTRLPVSPSWL